MYRLYRAGSNSGSVSSAVKSSPVKEIKKPVNNNQPDVGSTSKVSQPSKPISSPTTRPSQSSQKPSPSTVPKPIPPKLAALKKDTSKMSNTQLLLLWAQQIAEAKNVKITNWTTSWSDGMAYCALISYYRPDLIDMSKLDPNNKYDNVKLAFDIAWKHLKVPQLLDPEDMVETPEQRSNITYVIGLKTGLDATK